MAIYYLIPNGPGDKTTLAAGQTAISVAIQPTSTETVSRVYLESSKKSQLFIQHGKTSTGPWVSWNPDTGITVDETEQELYYYLEAGYYLRLQDNNLEGGENIIKAWVNTDSDPIYCNPQDVYDMSGLDTTVIDHSSIMKYIVWATSEIDRITGQIWNTRTATEKFNGDGTPRYGLRKMPLIQITSLTVKGESVTPAYVNTDEDTGQVILDTEEGAEVGRFHTSIDGKLLNTIVYTYGREEVPQYIKKLTAAIASIMALTEQTGGTYDDITSYTIGDRQVSVGEPWVNIENTMKHLERMVKELMKNITKPWNIY